MQITINTEEKQIVIVGGTVEEFVDFFVKNPYLKEYNVISQSQFITLPVFPDYPTNPFWTQPYYYTTGTNDIRN